MVLSLISFGDICAPACHCICGYTFTIPPLNIKNFCQKMFENRIFFMISVCRQLQGQAIDL